MQDEKRNLKLTELRDLLEDNIFGVDRDPDACRVARMSLAIALLDYADPPDVSGPTSNFQLPALSKNNILKGDFFELDPVWPRAKDKQPPQWIIGNPPWVELKSTKRAEDKKNKPAWVWFDKNKTKCPTSGNQVAEAFVWRVREFSRPDSVIGLVVPAMTFFKHEAKKFRQGIFQMIQIS
jgi:methylase of polypeptide subunit release factors